MDLTPLIQQAIKPVFWLIAFSIFISVLRTPKVKGIIGEAAIKFLARIRLSKDIYIPIHNVTLPSNEGTTQIDHIFVSVYGVFVVETKNMKGWIFGGEKQTKWTQQIYKVKNTFQNPLRQNYKHLKALEGILDIPEGSLKSVIAFTGQCTFKTDLPRNVTQGIGYIHYIKSFKQVILSDEQVNEVVNKINEPWFYLKSII